MKPHPLLIIAVGLFSIGTVFNKGFKEAHAGAQRQGISIVLPNVDLSDILASNDSLIIACRLPAPANALILIREDSTQQIAAALSAIVTDGALPKDQPGTFFKTNNWIFWPINTRKYLNRWRRTPGKATIELLVISDSGQVWGGEFGTFRGSGVDRIARSTVTPEPASLRNSSMSFQYRIDADADVNVEILSLQATNAKPLYTDRKADVPAGLRKYTWNFQSNSGQKIAAGQYYVRFRCAARNSSRQINDICLPFRVVR